MKTEFKQGKGRWNKKYWTVQYIGDEQMSHWRYYKSKKEFDLMFKYEEVAEIIETLLAVENQEKRPIKYKILKDKNVEDLSKEEFQELIKTEIPDNQFGGPPANAFPDEEEK